MDPTGFRFLYDFLFLKKGRKWLKLSIEFSQKEWETREREREREIESPFYFVVAV